MKFLGVFAPTQLPLAVMEGLLTVVIVIALESYAKPELKAVGFLKRRKSRMSKKKKTLVLVLLLAVVLLAAVPFLTLKDADFGGSR